MASHPIQYQAPLFRELARRCELKVFFAHRQSAIQQGEAGFGMPFDWDTNVEGGYDSCFLHNVARRSNVSTFAGCDSPEVAGLIDSYDFDAVVLTGWNLKVYWQALYACKQRGIPVLVRGDSELQTPRSRLRRAVKAVGYPLFLRSFDGFLFVGVRNREYLLHYKVPPEKLFFCPHCVDSKWFSEMAALARPGAGELLEGIGGTPRLPVALFVGKFIATKRAHDFVMAIHRLCAAGVEVQGVLVGSGPLEEELKALARSGPARFVFAGFRNQKELPSFYSMADVLCLPSEGETWGLVVNEAMACGVPAVVTNAVGCAPDLVVPGLTGEVATVGDVASIAAAVGRVIGRGRSDIVRTELANRVASYSIDIAAGAIVSAARKLASAGH